MFSRQRTIKYALDIKQRRAILMSLNPIAHPDNATAHPDWVRDATSKNYVVMKKAVKDKLLKAQELAIKRRNKLVGR